MYILEKQGGLYADMGIQLLVYLLIFVAKIIEVSMMTLRVVLITRGEKRIGAVVGFFEVMLWLFIAAQVITDIQADPFKMVVYALGFACGNYSGSMVEDRLALGLSTLKVITDEKSGETMTCALRDKGFGVTVIRGEGRDSKRAVLMATGKRKKIKEAVSLVRSIEENAFISINDTKVVYGGFGFLRK